MNQFILTMRWLIELKNNKSSSLLHNRINLSIPQGTLDYGDMTRFLCFRFNHSKRGNHWTNQNTCTQPALLERGVHFAQLYVFTYLFLCCDVRYDFRHLRCSGFTCFICLFVLRLSGVQHYFHIRKSSCRWTVTRQMPLVGQDCLHFWSTWFHSNFWHGVHTAESFLLGVMLWGSLFVLSFFCWPL